MAAPRSALCAMFIRHIPFTIGRRELLEYFRQFGKVVKCDMHLDLKTGFHSGYGWVTFSEEAAAQNALSMSHVLDGYQIFVRQHVMRKKI